MIRKEFSEIQGIQVNPLKIINGPKGDVRHALKANDTSFLGFGEAYFSTMHQGEIKGWKRHNRATLNLVLSSGIVRFFAFDDRTDSVSKGAFAEIILSLDNYQRLTIGPGIWLAFQGLSENNAILNICNMQHDPTEADNREINDPIMPKLS
ncbi:dTDP-4-dehydrorhamnose 3,5-epimerase family protein [Leptospira vanthielii]|uniref:dTDP-4-dehydrorhamnose 3,5-epimerase n=1 Tax=Leptospira vanthielii TaxID=293085 RepID=A0ABY2NTT6_9LEPT|nr:dTDP-4-dehydrorhamnose 3,5-epimerase family protein [Leptospira vanthielii]TGM60671.1 dTDP-4-dehydrorhamnose 3,5-epimerase [Leptospira vanthielii]